MHDRKIGCLPVVDDAGGLVGVITETDLDPPAVTRHSILAWPV
jgi:CBS-domain-containing membrane protein